ncbi:hypothetical protein [Lutibacter sp.]|uniref:DUF7033 domain-containing protein n=1 Tax=Lutibacter sp. TaxID=1925666 RepID=UPI00273599D7|nr:hypothetical protein [Lutibacter sp.]MDP3311827.1 hypothetical protein [Lutibacter sp.]
MLLVYTPKITPRINYIFKHYFVRILQIPIKFTNVVDEFVAHNGPKMTYAKAPLGLEFFLKSHNLLLEQGVNDIEIQVLNWDETHCFFPMKEPSNIPFDIFAAGFYLISRYEEYLPHIRDFHDRYPVSESLAYKNGFLEKPLIDIWAYKLLDLFKRKFPNYPIQEREFISIATIDIDNAYAYKNKGFVRSLGGFANDIFQFNTANIWKRIKVILNFDKDPFDTYEEILKIKEEHNVNTLFFILIGSYTSFDRNLSYENMKFRSLIKYLADYTKVGLHPSYYSYLNYDKFKKEKLRLEGIINNDVTFSRQHYLRLKIPETYQHLIDADIKEDYSMGYANLAGFRASTCTPFYFYDLNYEIQTPLRVFPFVVMDFMLKDHMNLSKEESLAKILELKEEVKKVNGTFISLFHNETLSEYKEWEGWTEVYKKAVID